MKIQLDMYQTLAIAVLVLMLGTFLKKESSFWKNSVYLLLLSVDSYLQFSPASVTVRDWQNFPLMIPYGKSVWYSSLPL